ncbi:CocE/NonD family hydrolase [Inquilinus sp. CAU 1745]|uniref:CocE/NonD family hydrolase n=1 Tax=Inquilinus sp. CAU 1745 TaxID=3140369 RepID=UPI00325C2738
MDMTPAAPDAVVEHEHVEIALADGCRLAARIWMPADAETKPVPAILEYLPYRKNDGTLPRDAVRAPFIAARRYAYVRVDLRGTGESEGVMKDEYLPQELEDGCEVIAWLARQPWCDGNVGMVGISWGGFNGLQIAAMQPAALKAIVTLCSTDDRYADDVHYMGGTMVIDQISWASHMFAINTLPPDPRHVGERWRDMWLDRLKGSGLWLKTWLEHQTRDDYWKHGSVCEDISRIKVPVYAVSGWADGYCRAVFRLMETLEGPKKGLVGPWAHKYPHIGAPGPAIDWLTEELRWWDHWLKGKETGIMDEPQLRLYLQDHAEPRSSYSRREGRWIEEPSWPSPNVAWVAFALGADGRLARDVPANEEAALSVRSPLGVGLAGGKWCSYARPGDQPVDQRRDDAGSLVFETAPLGTPLHVVGDPVVELRFSVDRPVAQVAARLVDVAPDGAATRVSYGLLNLTHRDSHETPEALEPGKTYTARVQLKHVAQIFRAGHRLRLSISTSYFPVAWPAPDDATLTVHTGASRLHLPLREDALHAPEPRDLGHARGALAMPLEIDEPSTADWQVIENLADGSVRVEITADEGKSTIVGADLKTWGRTVETYGYQGNDYVSPWTSITSDYGMAREGWEVTSRTETCFSATKDHFVVAAHMRVWLGEEQVHEAQWDFRTPRHLI